MKYIEVGKSGIKASNVVMGCMRLKGKTVCGSRTCCTGSVGIRY